MRISGIEATTYIDSSVFGVDSQAEYSRYTCDTVIDHTQNNVLVTLTVTGTPDP